MTRGDGHFMSVGMGEAGGVLEFWSGKVRRLEVRRMVRLERKGSGYLGLIRKLRQRPERAPCHQVQGTRIEHIEICEGRVTPELVACRRTPKGRRPSGRLLRLPLVTDRGGYAPRGILAARPESPAAGAA